ncbi:MULTISPECIES: hypothetical protein [unclassified Mycobacterium]|uniref:PPE domain-containing protein n=1 Tax=unclassified Mycobacterium TaxID=2642494 RepID=UPI00073FE802|nr:MULTISPECIES: hypothetical protein [unclassified Mycobacterium]KUH85757.1 hypothetical protein AU186_23800 [Mycobacterium sp. GA-1999]KUH91614.1 hypothetical protein AU185_10865 [Mycobacterium sp. GA-0227b]KUH96147.1 hypothetical protein AU187_13065 [Mycobacterium sp. IS-1556]
MGEVQRVDPVELTRQSAEMQSQNWHNPAAEAVVPPDALPSSAAAVANLNDNAQSLLGFQRWAEAENQRIAEMLQIAADAYTKVDETYGRVIEDPERRAAVEAITVPAPSTPPPPLPTPVGAPRSLDADGYSDVHKTQVDLSAGDNGASLKTAMLQWSVAATRIRGNAPRPPAGDWEGAAADAAYARMAEFGGWLQQLAEGWRELAESAAKVLEAHDNAKSEHTGIHSEYVTLETQLRQLAAQMTPSNSVATQNEMAKVQKRMQELQQRSDEVRRQYAGDATFSPVRPAMPSRGDAEGAAMAGGGGGGGGRPGGDPAGMAETTAAPQGQPRTAAAERQPGGGARGGAPTGGGAPSGGGAPTGGSGAGAGTPSGPSGGAPSTPKLPTDPSLRPAAASGGGGSGGGSGGGGGDMPATPMSAPVTAETVAPAPTTPATASATAGPSADRTAGVMGGGMAPMGHGAGAQQGQEKRRDPRLAPDEDLYTEDRPWTEAVIGNRRRRDVGDGGGGGGVKDAT